MALLVQSRTLLHNKSPLLCKSFYYEAALKETLCLHQQQLNMTPETADTPNDCYTVPEYIHTYMQTLKIAPDWRFLPLISRFHSDTKPVWMYRHTKKKNVLSCLISARPLPFEKDASYSFQY